MGEEKEGSSEKTESRGRDEEGENLKSVVGGVGMGRVKTTINKGPLTFLFPKII